MLCKFIIQPFQLEFGSPSPQKNHHGRRANLKHGGGAPALAQGAPASDPSGVMMQMIEDRFPIKLFGSQANGLNVIPIKVHFPRQFHEGDVVAMILTFVLAVRNHHVHPDSLV